MKIRNGFVSNSSSSSFVVAFSEKPKNEMDVLKFMFGEKEEYGNINYYDYSASCYDVAKQVFQDINKKATNQDVINVFEERYLNYETNISLFGMPRKSWGIDTNRYCLSDEKLQKEIEELTIEVENQKRKLENRRSKILKDNGFLPGVQFAFEGGTNYNTKKPYTKKEVKEFKEFQEKRRKFESENKELQDIKRDLCELICHKKLANLKSEMNKKDAQNFINDNKDKFIFIVSYCDNEGGFKCVMEHGEIFKNVPHIRINQH